MSNNGQNRPMHYQAFIYDNIKDIKHVNNIIFFTYYKNVNP